MRFKEDDMTNADQPTQLPDGADDQGEFDTEGHSLSNGEFLNSTMRDRQREDAQISRDASHRRELKKPDKSLRDRLLGR